MLRPRVSHQSIAHRRLGQDVPGLSRVDLELLPQMPHVNPHVVAVLGVRGSPHFAQDLPMSEHFAGIGDEQAQQPKLDRREMNRRIGLVHGPQVQIDFDVAEGEHPIRAGPCFEVRRREVARTRASNSPTPKGLVR